MIRLGDLRAIKTDKFYDANHRYGGEFFLDTGERNSRDSIARNKEIDTLILGCTHYSLIEYEIARELPDIKQYVSGQSVFQEIIDSNDLTPQPGTFSLYVTGNTQDFTQKFFALNILPMPRVIQSAKT